MKYEAEGRFEVKPRNKQLNESLRRCKNEPHDAKAGNQQKRSRLNKHFRNAVADLLEGDEFDY